MTAQPEHMVPLGPDALRWITDAAGTAARIRDVRALAGATTSSVHAVTLAADDGALHRLVLRRYVDPAVLVSEPRAVEREAAVLRALERSRVAAPRLVAADPLGEHCGVPALLMTRLPGRLRTRPRSGLDGYVDALAAQLPAVHETPCPSDERFPTYRPYGADPPPTPPTWSRHPAAWQRAIEVHARPAPDDGVVIHRDYHPGNVLWRDGAISGIVDWAWACRGSRAADVAHCRTNLVLLAGLDMADAFLASWQRHAGIEVFDPAWDLRDAVDLVPALHGSRAALHRLDELVARSAAEV